MTTFYVYPVSIRKGRDGKYLAQFPDVPEALTDGATREEAYSESKDALAEALMSRMVDKEGIPAPSEVKGRLLPVALDPTVALKAALYHAVREQGLTVADLARLLDVDHKEARRLLDPHHVSKVPRIRQALASTGYEVFVGVQRKHDTRVTGDRRKARARTNKSTIAA
jgi:antitoxin HicB